MPTASPPVWRLNQRDCFAGAPLGDLACYVAGAADEPGVTVYGRVARDGKHIVLQYWLFYYDNLYRYPFLPPGPIWQSHEGDWEVVNVVLSNTKRPLSVGLSQHCSGETRPWAETELREGHPTVYVALGSHANYFEPGLHEFEQACLPAEVIAFFQQAGLPLPADVAADGPGAGPKRLGLEPAGIEQVSDDAPSWIAFPGFWGELQYFNAPAPIGTQSPSARRPSAPRSTRSGRSRSPRWRPGAEPRKLPAPRGAALPRGAGNARPGALARRKTVRTRNGQSWILPESTKGARMAYEELKERQSVVWGTGPYQRITETITDIHELVIDRLAPHRRGQMARPRLRHRRGGRARRRRRGRRHGRRPGARR